MSELLDSLQDILPYMKLAVWAMGAVLALIALAALTYIVRTTYGPLAGVMQWLVGYTPGEEPGEIARGISHGARMMVWAALIGLLGWFLFH